MVKDFDGEELKIGDRCVYMDTSKSNWNATVYVKKFTKLKVNIVYKPEYIQENTRGTFVDARNLIKTRRQL